MVFLRSNAFGGVIVIVCIFLFFACTRSQVENDAVQAQASEEEVAEAAESEAMRVEFVLHHPKAVQKNVFYHWRKLGDRYVDDAGNETDGALIDALRKAASEDFIANDYPLTCRQSQSEVQWRLRFEVDGQASEFVSSSQCLGLAPFNMTAGLGLAVQYNGKLGRALLALLEVRDAERWSKLELKPGLIDFGKDAELAWTFQRRADDKDGLIRAIHSSIMTAHPSFSEFLSVADSGPFLPDIVCNQAENANCDRLLGRYKIKVSEGVYFHQRIVLEAAALTYQSPASLKKIVKVMASPPFRAYFTAVGALSAQRLEAVSEADGKALVITWKSEGNNCAMIEALAPHFKSDRADDCSLYQFSIEGDKGAMHAIYYPGLSAFWLSDAPELEGFFDALFSDTEISQKKRKAFSKARQKKFLKSDVEIFVDLSGQLFAFETHGGKTRRMP